MVCAVCVDRSKSYRGSTAGEGVTQDGRDQASLPVPGDRTSSQGGRSQATTAKGQRRDTPGSDQDTTQTRELLRSRERSTDFLRKQEIEVSRPPPGGHGAKHACDTGMCLSVLLIIHGEYIILHVEYLVQ